MSEATDRWMKAMTRLKKAQEESWQVERALRQMADELRKWALISPDVEACTRRGFIIAPEWGSGANILPVPNFTGLPTKEKLSALVAEINSALLEGIRRFQSGSAQRAIASQ